MENKNMEMMNQVMEGTTNSNGGKVVGLALGALGVLGGIAAAVIYKKKKANKTEEVVDVEVVENNKSKSKK